MIKLIIQQKEEVLFSISFIKMKLLLLIVYPVDAKNYLELNPGLYTNNSDHRLSTDSA